MSSENEDQVLLKSPDENKPESQKKSKISYTRDFLLSLSELDICKKLPNGFDASILGEFRSLHGEYVSVPQGRSESLGSYTRVNQVRWETRSSGSSDKDGDLQSDWESVGQDSGRRFGNQTRRGWQNSEHDGLLGSGAFSRPTGYAAPKARGNVHYQLNRSTEPYQPPRPYKAMPYSKKDYTDSYNDETFGSTECASEDRAEEERKRRASFELMRKDQQKALQEKRKHILDNHKESLDSDIVALLGHSADEKSMGSENKSLKPHVASLSNSDSSTPLHTLASASRPLVPPGFASALVEKNLSVQSSRISLASEAGTVVVENRRSLRGTENIQDKGNIPTAFMLANMDKNAPKISSQLSVDAIEKRMAPIIIAEALKPTVDFENISGKTVVQEANEIWEDEIIIMDDSSCRKGLSSEPMKPVSQDSTTILEKLFSGALTKNYASPPNNLEHKGVKADEEKWNSVVLESSKFTHQFSEEEKKAEDDFSSRELLSLIVSNEKVGSQVPASTEKASERIPPNLTFESIAIPTKLPTSPATFSAIGVPLQYSPIDNRSPSSVVLTCEDLEQSILAEVKDTLSNPHLSFLGACTPFDGISEKQKANVDDSASHHLLSLLQKGVNLKESIPSPRPDIIESTKRSSSSHVVDHSFDDISKNAEMVQSSEQTLTLEALFGASFMNALHSAEAPVSAQRGSVGMENDKNVLHPHGVPSARVDDGFLSATPRELRSNKTISYGDVIALNNTQKELNISGCSPIEALKLGDTDIEKGGTLEIQLPEEDSLITVGDTLNSISTDSFNFENHKHDCLPENNNVEDHNDKFLNAIFSDGEQSRTHVSDGPTQLQKGPFEVVDPNDLYHCLHGRTSSQFSHPMNQSRPLFPPFNHLANRNPQMKFVGPAGMHHDAHHPFPHHDPYHIPRNAFSNAAAHHQMLQHMSVPENTHPHHPMHGFPRGVPMPHAINHMHGYMPEMNNMHNFPMHNQQPNLVSGRGMGLPGSGMGNPCGPHPDVLERLIEMEMRTSSKQTRPSMGVNVPGIYNHENMNFRYR